MHRIKTPRVRFFPALFAGTVFCTLVSCEMLVDEMRIRRDPNTIVKPDVHELEALERGSGSYIDDGSPDYIGGQGIEDGWAQDPGAAGLQSQAYQQTDSNYTPIVPAVPEVQSPYPPASQPVAPPAAVQPSAAPYLQEPSAAPYVPEPSAAPYVPEPPQYDPSVIEELR